MKQVEEVHNAAKFNGRAAAQISAGKHPSRDLGLKKKEWQSIPQVP